MSNNKIIRTAQLLFRLTLYLLIALFLIFLLLPYWWYTGAEMAALLDVSSAFDPGFGMGEFRYYPGGQIPETGILLLRDLPGGMLFWMFLRGTAFFVLAILILRYILRILHSLRSLETFYHENSRYLRRIATLAFIGFILASFNFYQNEVSIQPAFGMLLLAAFARVLAEVFREGRQLAEDQKLIV